MSLPSRPSVLFVEDHSDTRAMMKHTLEDEYDVVLATDAEEALGLLGSEAFGGGVPDLFLLDIKLGEGRSGTELLSLLRDLEPTAEVPAVAITTYATASAREALLEAGFEVHLSKPFVRTELTEAIGEALSARNRT